VCSTQGGEEDEHDRITFDEVWEKVKKRYDQARRKHTTDEGDTEDDSTEGAGVRDEQDGTDPYLKTKSRVAREYIRAKNEETRERRGKEAKRREATEEIERRMAGLQIAERMDTTVAANIARAIAAKTRSKRTGKHGEQWVQVYSDASVLRGEKGREGEDACGAGVWVADRRGQDGIDEKLMPAGRGAAVNLQWGGLERIDIAR
jgi:hypothetical protein